MNLPKSRTQDCNRHDAQNRLAQAAKFVEVAELVLDDISSPTNPGVAASLAVLAGIAASDAACCAKLRKRARGQSHEEAVAVLKTVAPDGPEMAKDLGRLLQRKDDSHYGIAFVSKSDATDMVVWAKRLAEMARAAVEA